MRRFGGANIQALNCTALHSTPLPLLPTTPPSAVASLAFMLMCQWGEGGGERERESERFFSLLRVSCVGSR
jgi:hypothetical protein